jgi:hypothetical protein
MAVRLSGIRAGSPLPSGRFVVYISVTSKVEPRAIVLLEELVELKKKYNYLIRNRTSDIPVCSIVPLQPTTISKCLMQYAAYQIYKF